MNKKNNMGELFDSIADHFDKTRNRPWKDVEEFIGAIEGDILDLGCGNGRHCSAAVEKDLRTVGLDASVELLKIAKQRCKKGDYIKGDTRLLPFKDESFDGVLYIAAIHHLREGKVRSLKECKRILRTDGKLLVSSWSRESDRWDIPDKKREVIVPWTRDDGVVFERYYHLYTLDELEEDVIKSGLQVEESFLSGENNYVIAVKEDKTLYTVGDSDSHRV
ncbi:MAG: class I SAM-dependent methyltransferase [Thermoplasmata archaeon]